MFLLDIVKALLIVPGFGSSAIGFVIAYLSQRNARLLKEDVRTLTLYNQDKAKKLTEQSQTVALLGLLAGALSGFVFHMKTTLARKKVEYALARDAQKALAASRDGSLLNTELFLEILKGVVTSKEFLVISSTGLCGLALFKFVKLRVDLAAYYLKQNNMEREVDRREKKMSDDIERYKIIKDLERESLNQFRPGQYVSVSRARQAETVYLANKEREKQREKIRAAVDADVRGDNS